MKYKIKHQYQIPKRLAAHTHQEKGGGGGGGFIFYTEIWNTVILENLGEDYIQIQQNYILKNSMASYQHTYFSRNDIQKSQYSSLWGEGKTTQIKGLRNLTMSGSALFYSKKKKGHTKRVILIKILWHGNMLRSNNTYFSIKKKKNLLLVLQKKIGA